MNVTLFLLLAAAAAAGLYVGAEIRHALRRPPDLRGDWWGRFERKFRAYLRARERKQRPARRAPSDCPQDPK
jgi:hypothetical protein